MDVGRRVEPVLIAPSAGRTLQLAVSAPARMLQLLHEVAQSLSCGGRSLVETIGIEHLEHVATNSVGFIAVGQW